MENVIIPSSDWFPKNVQWVIKISKLCNLRCQYCYEYPFLGDKTKMELFQIEAMFLNIASFYKNNSMPKKMDFVWHGGEPLLLNAEYYESIFKMQNDIFRPLNIIFENSVQTNLMQLNDNIFELLTNKSFTNVGVSIDLFGDQRVDKAGKPVELKVIKNIQKLKDNNVQFGCITVLSQKTLPYIDKIYTFFENIHTSFRILPIYRTGFDGQHDNNSVSDKEIVNTYISFFERWINSDTHIRVRPLEDYIVNVIRQIDNDIKGKYYYNKENLEMLFIVDTNGSVYSNADAYNNTLCYGNIFKSSLSTILQSEKHDESVNLSNIRMKDACFNCTMYGSCSGFFIGEATPEQRFYDQNGNLFCGIAKPIQEYIKRRLIDLNLVERLKGEIEITEIFPQSPPIGQKPQTI